LAGERANPLRSGTTARFLRWEIRKAGCEQKHVLSTSGPFRVEFAVDLSIALRAGEYGISLFNGERQLIWARGEQNLVVRPGVHVLSHRFDSLPLRPGAYQWQVSIWDGGEMLDSWD